MSAGTTLPTALIADDVFRDELVAVNAMSLRLSEAVALRVAERADRLNVAVMFGIIAFVMIVFVATLTFTPDVAAIDARNRIWMRSTSRANLDVDPLSCLLFVTVSRRIRLRTETRRSNSPTDLSNHIGSSLVRSYGSVSSNTVAMTLCEWRSRTTFSVR